MITVHTIVKNEDRFIKPVLLAVESFPEVKKILVYDTGSTDKTISEIQSIKSEKIELSICHPELAEGSPTNVGLACARDSSTTLGMTKAVKMTRKNLVDLRNQQIKATTTPWILLVDGDEIWPKKNLKKLIQAIKSAPKETIALVNHTRNCIKDIYHYLPESQGDYQIGPWRGHLNIRAIRNLPGLKVVGEYPLEAYTINNAPIQDQPDKLKFIDTWYLHLTHLKRSSSWLSELKVIDRLKKHKWFSRLKPLKLKPDEIPETLVNYPR